MERIVKLSTFSHDYGFTYWIVWREGYNLRKECDLLVFLSRVMADMRPDKETGLLYAHDN